MKRAVMSVSGRRCHWWAACGSESKGPMRGGADGVGGAFLPLSSIFTFPTPVAGSSSGATSAHFSRHMLLPLLLLFFFFLSTFLDQQGRLHKHSTSFCTGGPSPAPVYSPRRGPNRIHLVYSRPLTYSWSVIPVINSASISIGILSAPGTPLCSRAFLLQ
jgi:hypothetical protein